MLLSKQSELDRKKQEISSQQCELVKKERDRRNADDLYEQKKREYQKKKKECIISSVATGAGTVVVSLLTLGLGAIPAGSYLFIYLFLTREQYFHIISENKRR